VARDGLLPNLFTKLHPHFATPHYGIIITGFIMMIIAGFSPVATLMQLSSMCALANFSLVSLSAMIMRYKHPNQPRPFRCPAIYLVASISLSLCLFFFLQLLPENWIPFGSSLFLGIIGYLCYGYRKSPLAK
jgi:APA family basic amino acid/polyamine antiporter